MVKVFIPVRSEVELVTSLDNYVIERKFGKAPWYMIIDSESLEFQVYQNSSRHLGGQGCTADMVTESGAEITIAAHMGPGAWNNLQKRGIKMYRGDLRVPIPRLIEKMNNNELTEFSEPKEHSHDHDHQH
jgi:predicted Fe-Mo cluster-binding NifX family protein